MPERKSLEQDSCAVMGSNQTSSNATARSTIPQTKENTADEGEAQKEVIENAEDREGGASPKSVPQQPPSSDALESGKTNA